MARQNTNFFSSIQRKFKAEFHGRYIGNIIEQIASKRIEVIFPLFNIAPLENRWKKKELQDVTTEFSYLVNKERIDVEDDGKDRRADLAIELDSGSKKGIILVEIKIKDGFLPGQLDQYINWAKGRQKIEDRAVVFLTAFPLAESERCCIEMNSKYVAHMYFSELNDKLRSGSLNSELVDFFVDYLCQEGYAMYQLPINDEKNNNDYDALLSFMVFTFLPHASGKGRASSAKKISRGPEVFGNLVQNWQQVSDRLADLKLGAERRPTIRYFPQQGSQSLDEDGLDLSEENLLDYRRGVRKYKKWGRFWLTADRVLEGSVRIEWGQIIEIKQGASEGNIDIDCYLYALIRDGLIQISSEKVKIKGGIENRNLYSSEVFVHELSKVLARVKGKALSEGAVVADSIRSKLQGILKE